MFSTSRKRVPEPPEKPPHLIESYSGQALSDYHLTSTHILTALVGAILLRGTYVRYFRRIQNIDYLPPKLITKKRWVKGYVTKVRDGDNFRLYHTPAFGWRFPIKFRHIPDKTKDLVDQTLHIRMAGIDAPEISHFGNPGQEFGDEALAWTKQTLEGKFIYCQLLRRDQYRRIVAVPMLPWPLLPNFFTPLFGIGKCVSFEMLKAGWAVTYVEGGAVYGKWGAAKFLKLEAQAKKKKIGQWARGTDVESPAEYKRRYARQGSTSATLDVTAVDDIPEVVEKPKKAKTVTKRKAKGWLKWFLGK
ncbi:hypothetical protein M0805_003065 [Coniferiporia weirii]|nr:hypothetical protein M0805_003065 [Coniferiporia weirii]